MGESYSGIDSVCRGEYELTLLDLTKTLDAGDTLMGVDGLSFRLDGVRSGDSKERVVGKKGCCQYLASAKIAQGKFAFMFLPQKEYVRRP